jgi:succinylglutamate desuccinylase
MIAEADLLTIGEATAVRGVRVLRSGHPGPVVGFMGMLHGNEPAGIGLWRLAKEIGKPARGEIRLIVGHPDAMEAEPGGVRYIEHDLNRMFMSVEDLTAAGVDLEGPDYRRMVELKPALAELDVLLDIHTTSQPSEPFAIGYTANPEARRLSRALPVTLVDGLHQFIKGAACQWVLDRGRAAVTVEVGAHLDPAAPEHAAKVARRFLAELDMLPPDQTQSQAVAPASGVRRIVVGHHIASVGRDFRYTRHFHNFDPLEPGEIVGRDADTVYRAPMIDNPVIFMPSAEATLRDDTNTDAFFFGVEVAPSDTDDHQPLAQTV